MQSKNRTHGFKRDILEPRSLQNNPMQVYLKGSSSFLNGTTLKKEYTKWYPEMNFSGA